MTKAILVIDMPSSCKECPLIDQITGACHYGDVDGYNYKIIRNGCPLKPLPKKRDKHQAKIVVKSEEEATNMQILINQCCDIGFNACLYEILGEEDE